MANRSLDPKRTQHLVFRMPRLVPHPSDAWVDATYALIEAFEADPHGAARGQVIEVPSIIAACDYLWARFEGQAAWGRLDVFELFAMFPRFAESPYWRRGCMITLDAFYTYLVRIGVVEADAGARVHAELRRERAVAEAELADLPRKPNRRERRAHASGRRAARRP